MSMYTSGDELKSNEVVDDQRILSLFQLISKISLKLKFVIRSFSLIPADDVLAVMMSVEKVPLPDRWFDM